MHACKQTETSLVELQSGLHLLLQWPHTASIIQRSSRWQDNSVCDVIFWFPRFTRGVSAHTSRRREILFMPGRFAIYSVRKEFLGTGVYVSCGRTLFNFYTVGHPLKTTAANRYCECSFLCKFTTVFLSKFFFLSGQTAPRTSVERAPSQISGDHIRG